MKKIYSLICALLLAQGAMATDYDQLKKSGKINAYAGLKYILDQKATLYNMYGHQVASVSNAGNTVTISAEGQKKGVYILRISDGKQTHAQKVVVR